MIQGHRCRHHCVRRVRHHRTTPTRATVAATAASCTSHTDITATATATATVATARSYVPVSGFLGENLTAMGDGLCPWYAGPSLVTAIGSSRRARACKRRACPGSAPDASLVLAAPCAIGDSPPPPPSSL